MRIWSAQVGDNPPWLSKSPKLVSASQPEVRRKGGGPHEKNSDWLLSVPIRQKLREKSCSCRPIRVVEGEEVRDLNYF